MTWPGAAAAARYYLALAPVAGVFSGSLAHVAASLALVAAQGASLVTQPHPRIGLVTGLVTALLLPILVEPLLGPVLASLLVAPGLPWLDAQLRDLGPRGLPASAGLATTSRLHALLLALGAAAMLGTVASAPALASASLVLAAAVTARFAQEALGLSRRPLTVVVRRVRVLAGEAGSTLLEVSNTGREALEATLTPSVPWVRLSPSKLRLAPGQSAQLKATVTPPLAGPAHPAVRVSVWGERGLATMTYSLEPLEVHSVPRARYAAWLSMRYLEATARRQGAPSGSPQPRAGSRPGGPEYERLREYQTGDRLRHVDWRHTIKLERLIVRDFVEYPTGEAVLLVNLAADDPDSADRLVYWVLTAALSAARQGSRTYFMAYDQSSVVYQAGPMEGREALKEALRLCSRVVQGGASGRLLAPPNVPGLRRSLRALDRTGGGAAPLGLLLRLELRFLEEATRHHPLGALARAFAANVPRGAVVALASQRNHDMEALAVVLPVMEARGCTVMDLLNHPRNSPHGRHMAKRATDVSRAG